MFTDVVELVDRYESMQQTGIEPIILRFKLPCKNRRHVYGFFGFKVVRDELINGTVTITGIIDPNGNTIFHPDKFNIGFAVVPSCPRNLEIIRAIGKDGPYVIEEPKALKDELYGAPQVAIQAPASEGMTTILQPPAPKRVDSEETRLKKADALRKAREIKKANELARETDSTQEPAEDTGPTIEEMLEQD